MTQPQLSLAPQTRYDQAARYLLVKASGALFEWLTGLPPDRVRFGRWLPAQLTLPGVPERLCDGVAELADLDRGGAPVAALLEVQTQPDATMPGRLMLAGGLLWLTVKPTALPGDRYDLLGVVINLTGTGTAARRCAVGAAEWALRPVELNLEQLDAGTALDQVAAGAAPREVLAFVPLMRRGGDADIINRWRECVAAEPDPRRRGDFSLALVFAERVDRRAAWQNAVEGFSMIESPVIAELLAAAEEKAIARGLERGIAQGLAQGVAQGMAQGVAQGKAEGKAETLLRVLAKRFGAVPADVTAAVGRAGADQLGGWLDDALDATSMAHFRERTGL